jgi:hypothetical protein
MATLQKVYDILTNLVVKVERDLNYQTIKDKLNEYEGDGTYNTIYVDNITSNTGTSVQIEDILIDNENITATTITTDAIIEKTIDTGIMIDDVLIKDNLIIGDIASTDGTIILNHGTDGTDATFTGTILTGSQPNITSLGTLESLNMDGDITSSSGDVTINDNCVINGNLLVNGTTTTIESETIRIEDNLIVVNSGPNSSHDGGLLIQRYQKANDLGSGDVVNDIPKVSNTLPDQSGMSNIQITLHSGASVIDDFYNNWWIKITSGLNEDQVRHIIDYDGTTQVATLESEWTTQNPSSGDTFNLYNKPFVGIFYDESNDKFVFGATTSDPGKSSIIIQDYMNLNINSLNTNIINELTNDVGVTIDNLLIKDGGLIMKDSTTYFQDNIDITKQFQFELSGITSGTTKTLTIPDDDGTIILNNATQTLTNKTLQDSTTYFQDNIDITKQFQFELSGITSETTKTLTIPDDDGTIILNNATQTLTNKTLQDSTTYFQDNIDITKQFQFELSGITSGTTKTLTIPDDDGTIILNNATQTLTNKTLEDSTTFFKNEDDEENIRQFQFDLTEITPETTRTLTIPDENGTITLNDATQTLTNKTLEDSTTLFKNDDGENTRQFQFDLTGITPETTRILTIPDENGTIILNNATQTLTNKTLQDSTTYFQDNIDITKQFQFELSSITSGTTKTLTIPDDDGTITLNDATQTLTNKTLQDSTTYFQDNIDITKQFQFELSSITSGTTKTLTIPDDDGTIILNNATQTLTNKTLQDSTTYFQDNIDITKQFQFELSSITSGTTKTLTIPDENGTITLNDATQTLTNKTLEDSTTLFKNDDGENTRQFQFDLTGITPETTRILTIPDENGTIILNNATQTLTNKTLQDSTTYFQDNIDITKQFQFELSSITSGTTKTLTIPDENGTITLNDATQTLTNKTLEDSTTLFKNDDGENTRQFQFDLTGITPETTRILTIPDENGTIILNNATQTLTNKTLQDSTTYFQDNIDITKQFQFELSSITSGTTKTLTIPDDDGTITLNDATQTLTNKTLQDSTTYFQDNIDITKQFQFELSSITSGTTKTLTIPDDDGTIILNNATQTLTNKTLQDSTTYFQDNIDITKQFQFELSSITSGTTKTLTIPDDDGTIILNNATQTLTNKTLEDSTTFFKNEDDEENIRQFQFDLTEITPETTRTLTIPDENGTITLNDATQTLTNKTLEDSTTLFKNDDGENTRQFQFDLTGITPETTRTLTIPDENGTITLNDATQTLTNKTLEDSTTLFKNDDGENTRQFQFDLTGITPETTRILTIPDDDGTIILNNATQTLTNKTLQDSTTYFQDNIDITKQFQFELSSITSGTTKTLTIPDDDGTIILNNATQTLTNKTLEDSTTLFKNDDGENTRQFQFDLTGITPGTTKTLTIPDDDGTIILNNATQTLTNKTLQDSTTYFQDNIDITKQFQFELSSITSGTTKTLTIPDDNGTIILNNATQTLTNKTLQDSTTYFQDNTDITKQLQFQLSGITSGTTRTLTIPNNNGTITLNNAAQLLTNKTLEDSTTLFRNNIDTTKKCQFQLSDITSGVTRTLTIPDEDGIITLNDATQTLTNKTITMGGDLDINGYKIVDESGTVEIDDNCVITGNLTVNGTNN